MFPLNDYGELKRSRVTVTGPEDFKQQFLFRASDELKKVKARNVEIQGDRISFNGGMFRAVSNWNILTQIDYGYLEIKEAEDEFIITYFISFGVLFICACALVVCLGGILFIQNTPLSLAGWLALLVLAWLWLFGVNWLVAIARFPPFVERILWDKRT
jgi:hypothetical protein